MPMSAILKKHFKSPFPALNVFHQNELVATDTISLTPLPLMVVQLLVRFLLVLILLCLMLMA
jgi:hypothetical protein